jgi:hypothetical protein
MGRAVSGFSEGDRVPKRGISGEIEDLRIAAGQTSNALRVSLRRRQTWSKVLIISSRRADIAWLFVSAFIPWILAQGGQKHIGRFNAFGSKVAGW